jgi:hypothetical protein
MNLTEVAQTAGLLYRRLPAGFQPARSGQVLASQCFECLPTTSRRYSRPAVCATLHCAGRFMVPMHVRTQMEALQDSRPMDPRYPRREAGTA